MICKLEEGPSNLHFKVRPGCFKKVTLYLFSEPGKPQDVL